MANCAKPTPKMPIGRLPNLQKWQFMLTIDFFKKKLSKVLNKVYEYDFGNLDKHDPYCQLEGSQQ